MKRRILAFALLATLFACSNDDSVKQEEPTTVLCDCEIKRYRVNTNASGYPIDTVFVSNINQNVQEECGTVRTQIVPLQGNMFWYMYDKYTCQ